MAFPATYDFNYYKGDTFEFRIYPKKNDGTVYELSGFKVPTNFANTPDYYTDTIAPYDSAQFTISTVRGATGSPIKGFARISDDGTFVQCAIRPTEGNTLVAGTEYVYDVEVRKPAGSPGTGQYEVVHTLLTGTITITDQVTGANFDTKTTLSNFTILGLSAPVTCATPDTDIIQTSEYSGTVVWQGISDPENFVFAPDTQYTAIITITPRDPYQIYGTPKNKFIVNGASTTTNPINSGVVTAVFPKTEKVVSLLSISGVVAPVKNQTPNTSVSATDQYTASLSWKEKSLTDPVVYENFTGNFKPSRTYAAIISLTPKTGYTLCTGIAEDSFSVVGALNYTNSENSGIIISEFPVTEA